MPLVSVIMPVYNGEKFLREAMDSILAQTFKDFELIVIDDGSTDSTPELLREYANRDGRVRIKYQSSNTGIVTALNNGCQLAGGEYIARMDADDIALPERFAQEVEYLNSHPDVGLVGTGFQLIDFQGNPEGIILFPETHSQICWSLCFYNPIAHPTTMMRRVVFLQAGGYRKGYLNGEDYDLWRRVSRHARLANLSGVLLLLRKHASNLTVKQADQGSLSGIRVARELICDILGREIPKEPLEILWDSKRVDTGQRRFAAQLLMELSQEFLDGLTSSKEERLFISREVARRLASLALRKISFESIFIIIKALPYDAKVVFNTTILDLRMKTKKLLFH